MKSLVSVTAAVVVAALAGFPNASEAAEKSAGWYAGVNVGHSKLSAHDRNIVADEDLSDTSLAVHGGYRFSRYFAVEGSFADLGGFHYVADTCLDVCIPEQASTRFQHTATRLDLSLVGSLRLGERLQADGRVGVASTNLKTETRTLAGANQYDRSDLSAVYGVGLRVSFESPWSVRLQWDRSAHSKGNDLDVGTLWLGGEYQFGGQAL